MAKIIVIAEYFNPDNKIAAVRTSNIANELCLAGNNVNVLTVDNSYNTPQCDLSISDDINTVYVELNDFRGKLLKKIDRCQIRAVSGGNAVSSRGAYGSRGGIGKLLKRVIRPFFYASKSMLRSRSVYLNMKRYLKNHAEFGDVDYVWTSYGEFAPHKIGAYLKKRNPKLKWVADFRDAINPNYTTFPYKLYFKNFAKRHLKKADAFTGVSDGVLKDTNLPEKVPRFVVTNGFRDFNKIDCVKKDFLNVVYTGMLHPERKFNQFFDALRTLENERGKLKIKIDYYGGDGSLFIANAAEYQMERYVADCGRVSMSEARKAQSEADILLSASWNNVGSSGILTGKIFEYMASKKPIIACISGNLANSELKALIEDCNLGVAAEEIEGSVGTLRIYDFLKLVYDKISAGGKFVQDIDDDKIKRYRYCNIVSDLLGIYERI